jgi:hypothetical protein
MTIDERLLILKKDLYREDYEAVIDAVIACPSRGAILPPTRQVSVCESCELYECSEFITTHQINCIRCQCGKLGIT